jgi:homospermidine synthase
MDFRRCSRIQRPYLGPVTGHYTDWTPLAGRGELFPEDVDASDRGSSRTCSLRLTARGERRD